MSEFRSNVNDINQEAGLRAFLNGTFTKMAVGLAVTAMVAYLCYNSLNTGGIMYTIMAQFPWVMIVALVVEIIICLVLSVRLMKMQPMTANILFYAYAVITGISFSFLPYAYGVENIFLAFAFASVLFVSCAIIGHTTKVDLTKFSGLMIGGLVAIVIASVVGFFFKVPGMTLIISYVGVLLFLGITAWDVQKLKHYYYSMEGSEAMVSKMSIFGAFQLYLDFINIFLYVLRILANSRKD